MFLVRIALVYAKPKVCNVSSCIKISFPGEQHPSVGSAAGVASSEIFLSSVIKVSVTSSFISSLLTEASVQAYYILWL